MNTFVRMVCVAAIACSVFISRSSAWSDQFYASTSDSSVHQTESISVPATSSVYIYGTSEWGSIASGHGLLRVSTPSQTIDCYTYYSAYTNVETNDAHAYNQSAGTYQVDFTAEFPWDASSGAYVYYYVNIDW